jgi:hypothetical protein
VVDDDSYHRLQELETVEEKEQEEQIAKQEEEEDKEERKIRRDDTEDSRAYGLGDIPLVRRRLSTLVPNQGRHVVRELL